MRHLNKAQMGLVALKIFSQGFTTERNCLGSLEMKRCVDVPGPYSVRREFPVKGTLPWQMPGHKETAGMSSLRLGFVVYMFHFRPII